jgi:beta-glucosidase
MFEALPVAHHQLLAHGMATRALRAAGATNIGIANHHVPVWPASDNEADQSAAALYDGLVNDMFAAPVLAGRYPTDELADAMPGPVAEDLEIISTPLDWYGVNYYLPSRVAAPSASDAPTVVDGVAMPEGLPFDFPVIDGYPVTDFGWPIVPNGLHETLTMLADRYDLPPVYITEGGCSFHDEVHDQRRIDYLDGHLRAVHQAIRDGIDVRGYFVWSIVDNFEWAVGYSQRFGLVHVDYDTLVRTPKDSYRWYRDLIRAQR